MSTDDPSPMRDRIEPTMSLVSIESLSFTYPGSSTQALSGISLSLEPGEYLAIVGANGSGKSTLIRCLNGLLVPPRGTVRVDGFDPADIAGRIGARRALSLVFQSPVDQIVASIVEEDVAFGLENLGVPYDEMHQRVEQALGAVDLLAQRHRSPRFLSSGQQQRLAVAGALAMRPRIVAFDEATSMIDPIGRAAVLRLMDELVADGIAVIHVTHDMDEAARARRVAVLSEGRLVFSDTPRRLFATDLPARYRLERPQAYDAALRLGLEPKMGEDAAALGRRAATAPGQDIRAAIDRLHPATGPAQAARPAGIAFRVHDASMTYRSGTPADHPAVWRATIDIPAGSLVALVGKTGAGKSSLLQLLDALAIPDSGTVDSLGTITSSRSADLRSLRMRAPLAVQRPESAIFEAYVGDEAAFGPRNQGLRGAELVGRVRAALDAVGLPFDTYRDALTRTLSGGMKRRLALASILSLDPDALLLDEPTSALDPATRREVLALIQAYAKQGRTVVMSTHSMDEAALADMVIVMREGALVASGPPDAVFGAGWDESWGIDRPFAWALAVAANAALSLEAVR